MRVVAGLAAILFFSGPPVMAQSALPPSGNTTIHPGEWVPGCPIDMRVRQRMDGGMVAVDQNGNKRRVFAPRLRLFVNDLRPGRADQTILSAAVTVHVSTANPHMQPITSRPPGDWDIERTLNVDLAHWDDPGVSGDFRLPGFTTAGRVDLDSVTYADGSTWKLSGNETCRVAPDPLMLINQ